jgi:hypothetical protein
VNTWKKLCVCQLRRDYPDGGKIAYIRAQNQETGTHDEDQGNSKQHNLIVGHINTSHFHDKHDITKKVLNFSCSTEGQSEDPGDLGRLHTTPVIHDAAANVKQT